MTDGSSGAPSVYLELCVFVHVLSPLPVQDELRLVGNSHNVVLHGVAQESGEGVRNTGTLQRTQAPLTPPFTTQLQKNVIPDEREFDP